MKLTKKQFKAYLETKINYPYEKGNTLAKYVYKWGLIPKSLFTTFPLQ